MGLDSSTLETHHIVSYVTEKQQLEGIYRWNTINTILSIRTYFNARIILLPTILLSFLSSTLFRTFQSLWILIRCSPHLALTLLEVIIFAVLITCTAMSFPVHHMMSTKNMFGCCPNFNFKVCEREQVYEICQYMKYIIICLFVYNAIYSLSNSSYSKVHLNDHAVVYGCNTGRSTLSPNQ